MPTLAQAGFFASLAETFDTYVNVAVGFLFQWGLVYLLIGVGVVITFYLGAPQIRNLKEIFTSFKGSRRRIDPEISSFQAFAVGIATRVGIGNIGGVALALIMGGPGAIFWMWIIAFIGMATAFAESTLAQLFKIRHNDGTFRGGPAYFISRGLGWKKIAYLFAGITIFSSGMAVPMVQVNTVAATVQESHHVAPWMTGVVMMVLLAPVIIGGIRWVAKVSEYLAPIMALLYIAITVVIIVQALIVAPETVGNAFASIFGMAFGWKAAAGGMLGAIFQALIQGARRGLFSNEAGLGTFSNAAGAATVKHPCQQGFLQAFGVFVDTMIVCTSTALIILIANPVVPTDPNEAGALTATSVAQSLGPWMEPVMTIIIFIFGYTTAFGAYSYGQVSLDHFTQNSAVSLIYRCIVVVLCGVGAVAQLSTVWALADLMLGLGAIINLIAVLMLAKWARGALKDWNAQRAERKKPVFISTDNKYMPAELPGRIWRTDSA
ncbi:MAG: alanine/glycine:cation symporter family protein [Actinomycetaceae bacterium]|nr:alanine/glycine:cation symporter family protein [Actinomycetaceae bacterium]